LKEDEPSKRSETTARIQIRLKFHAWIARVFREGARETRVRRSIEANLTAGNYAVFVWVLFTFDEHSE
jgi:hypothetical protein